MAAQNTEWNGKYKKQFNWIASRYEFRLNLAGNVHEYRKRLKGRNVFTEWQPVEDSTINNIFIELLNDDLDLPKDKLTSFIESDYMAPKYDPFVEYFNSLSAWDGIDYIGYLAKTVQTPYPDMFNEALKRFLVGSVATLLDQDTVNDAVLIFQGAQGIGKTRWIRKLLPEKFRRDYLYENHIDPTNKDDNINLSLYWFINLDELENFKGRYLNSMKAYISRLRIKLRRAYGKKDAKYIRRASFLGSVNDEKFLSDMTGSRRWFIFKTLSIDYMHVVDIDRVWAQAKHLYVDGFEYWLDRESIDSLNQINEQFREIPIEEEQLLQFFEIPESDDDIDSDHKWYSTSDIISEMAILRPSTLSKINNIILGKALSKHCTVKKRQNGVSKYLLKMVGHQNTQFAENNNEEIPF